MRLLARTNPVLLLLAGLILLALINLPFLRIAPNRLVSGEPVYFFSLLAGVTWYLALASFALLVAAFFRQSRALLVLVLLTSAALPAGLLWLAATRR